MVKRARGSWTSGESSVVSSGSPPRSAEVIAGRSAASTGAAVCPSYILNEAGL